MITEYQRGRKEALKEIVDIFAEQADACQRKLREAIKLSRKAKADGDDALSRQHDKTMSSALAEKIAYMRALNIVMEFEGKERAKL